MHGLRWNFWAGVTVDYIDYGVTVDYIDYGQFEF